GDLDVARSAAAARLPDGHGDHDGTPEKQGSRPAHGRLFRFARQEIPVITSAPKGRTLCGGAVRESASRVPEGRNRYFARPIWNDRTRYRQSSMRKWSWRTRSEERRVGKEG